MALETVGLQLIASVLGTSDPLRAVALPENLFKGEEADVFQFVVGHISKTGAVPKHETIFNEVGVDLPSVVEPFEYYLDKTRTRYKHDTLRKLLLSAEEKLKDKQPDLALDIVLKGSVDLMRSLDHERVFDFGNGGLDFVLNEYKRKLMQGDNYGIQTGWATLDAHSGGLAAGDVLAIVGRPAAGKSYMSIFASDHAWAKQHKNVLFGSMEMKPLAVMQRLTALHFHIPSSQLKKAELTTHALKKLKQQAKALVLEDSKYWVVDGNLTASVADMAAYAKMLKVDAVYVDGAYLLQVVNGDRMARWERITKTAEGLKERIAQDLGVPVFASYQFSRDAVKKKKGQSSDDTGLEDIGGADAIGQIASIVLGLFDEPNIENALSKRVRIMKGREGEMGQFRVNWIFDKSHKTKFVHGADGSEKLVNLDLAYSGEAMNFSEITEAEMKEKEQEALGFL